jgi:Mrp family chromosome partitioning ATPase
VISKIAGSIFASTTALPGPKVIAIVSSQESEGTSTVTTLLAREFAGAAAKRTLVLRTSDLDFLCTGDRSMADAGFVQDQSFGYWKLKSQSNLEKSTSRWHMEQQTVKSLFIELGSNFDIILLDSRSMLDSNDVIRVGPLLSGVVTVVEAGRTARGELQSNLEALELAGCRLLGIVLNRRRFPIPSFIYRLLRSAA